LTTADVIDALLKVWPGESSRPKILRSPGGSPMKVTLRPLPSRDGELMRWCLGNGLRIASQATLMTIGLYSEPQGAYLPSVLY
jgi:hypothetical protein